MPKHSAGLLMYRYRNEVLEFFLVHPGGPFWAKKDIGAWSIPKGEYSLEEDALAAARREFTEETGLAAAGEFIPLTPLKQPSGKIISAWAFQGDCDPQAVKSNTFTLEWPPRSGRKQEFPEIDRAGWFTREEAKVKIIIGQLGFLEELEEILREKPA
jgi:predicted NUDIX family NTP pyrophosphohydrolase